MFRDCVTTFFISRVLNIVRSVPLHSAAKSATLIYGGAISGVPLKPGLGNYVVYVTWV